MDNAHSHLLSSPVASTTCHRLTKRHAYTSPRIAPTTSFLSQDAPASRQQRLLRGRHARFSAKKMSINGLSNRLSQLIHANEDEEGVPQKNQENSIRKQSSTNSLRKRLTKSQSLGILDEISNTTKHRSLRRRGNFALYHDNEDILDSQERPLLQSSPIGSPQAYQEASSEIQSPVGLDFTHIQDGLGNMRLKEISGNERRLTPTRSSHTSRKTPAPRSRSSFDSENYIDHLERELQQSKDEALSPRTKRPLRDKLRSVIIDNERLQRELAHLREGFEIELKKTVEHKTTAELELQRKVRDLEERLEEKDLIIGELQYQREEKRLDSNVCETLKTTIDRLEQEKQNLRDENLNITKRNDVLTQLLAMSPTKIHGSGFASPAREKRGGRPLSLILPRLPSSPSTKFVGGTGSVVASPIVQPSPSLTTSEMALNEARAKLEGVDITPYPMENGLTPKRHSLVDMTISPQSLTQTRSKRWTLRSDLSDTSAWGIPPDQSPSDDNRNTYKRRPRRFLRGSTQLKPLLLPTLNSDFTTTSSPSPLSSPRPDRSISPSELSLDTSSSVVRRTLPETDDESVTSSDAQDDGTVPDESALVISDDKVNYESNQLFVPVHGPLDELPATTTLTADFHGTFCDDDYLDILDPSLQCNFVEQSLIPFLPPITQDGDLDYQQWLNSNDIDFLPYTSEEENAIESMCAYIPPPLFSPEILSNEFDTQPTHSFRHASGSSVFEPPINLRKRKKLCTERKDSFAEATNNLLYTANTSNSCRESPPLTPASVISEELHQDVPNGELKSASEQLIKHIRKQSITPLHIQRLGMTRSPLNLLECGSFNSRPIASISMRQLYKLVSNCKSYIRQFQKDPYALARRVLANAWRGNWVAMGQLSWWVLGLFLGPGHTHVRRRDIDWGKYDGECIANQACWPEADHFHSPYPVSQQEQLDGEQNHQHNMEDFDDENFPKTHHKPKEKIGWTQSLMLWGKFSVAVLLAVGGAVVHGPAEMLKDLDKTKRKSLELSLRTTPPANTSTGYFRRPEVLVASSGSGTSGASIQTRDDCRPPELHTPPMFTFRSNLQLNTSPITIFQESSDSNKTLRPVYHGRPQVGLLFCADSQNASQGPKDDLELLSPRSEAIIHEETIQDGYPDWPPSPASLADEDPR